MCRCIALSRHPCLYRRAIPQPMPLPKVPIRVFCLSAHNFGKADITRRRRVTSLISDIPIRKIAPKSDFSCIYQKLVVPSNICLPTAFPRSYVRKMQPILQPLTLLIKNVRLLAYVHFLLYLCTAFSQGKQVQFLHSPAAVIRNPMFKILKVTDP